MVWTALQKYSTMFIQFVSGIVLARLLSPSDYGCIGMLSIFMLVADAFINGGFGSALIQKKRPTQEDYSTVFFWNMGVAVVMYVTLYFCAPAISRFYNIEILCPVLRVQALVLFIHAFTLVQSNQLRKKFNFKLISIVTVATSVIALSITIFMAYKGFGVWALVAQNLITAAIPALVYWFYVKWRPMMIFSKESFKELFSFGFYMFLTTLVNDFCKTIQTLFIGKLYPPATLGYYSKAQSTEKLASHSISSTLTSVTYPMYAEVQDDKPAMINMIKRLTCTIAYMTFPLMFILILTAKPIFVLLYSEKWLQSVPYFQALCLVGLSSCLQAVNTQTIAAIGKSKTMFLWTVGKRTFGLTFMLGGLLLYEMKGFVIGVVLYNWFCYFVNIGLVSKHIGYKWSRQLLDLLPVTAASVICALISYFAVRPIHLSLYMDGVLKLLIYAALYIAWSLIFKPDSYSYAMKLIPDKYKFWNRKKC